jgi:hypothetical protein
MSTSARTSSGSRGQYGRVDDADGDRSTLVGEGSAHLLVGNQSGARRAARQPPQIGAVRAAIGLEDVTVDGDLDLTLAVRSVTPQTGDEALDLLRTA